MCLSDDDVCGVVQNVWKTMLELEATIGEGDPFAEGSRVFTASIQIAGPWQGAVTLTCPERAVRQAGAAMFCQEEDEVSEDDMHDALNELVNIIGGNIKDRVPGPGFLALPTIVVGQKYDIEIPGTQKIAQVALQCGAVPFVTALFERREV